MTDFFIFDMIATIFGELLELFSSVYFKDGENRKSDFKLLPAASLKNTYYSLYFSWQFLDRGFIRVLFK